MQTSSLCTFCCQNIIITDDQHPCAEKLHSLIPNILQSKKNSPGPFDNIINLVFQGGGVKGVAYVGVLKQLQEEGKKRNRDFLGGVKRIAGTSAGSITALYLGLNMDVETEIAPLMQREYSKLLDDGLILKVKVDKFLGYIRQSEYKNFRARDIVLETLKYFKDLTAKLESGDAQAREEAEKKLREAVNKVFGYYGEKFGLLAALYAKVKGSSYARNVVEWLFDFLTTPFKLESPEVQTGADLIDEESKNNSRIYEEPLKRSTSEEAMNPPLFSYMAESPSIPKTFDYEKISMKAEPRDFSQEDQRSTGPETVSPDQYMEAYAENSRSFVTSSSKAKSRSFKDIVLDECSRVMSEHEIISLGAQSRSISVSPHQKNPSPEVIGDHNGSYISLIKQRSPAPSMGNYGSNLGLNLNNSFNQRSFVLEFSRNPSGHSSTLSNPSVLMGPNDKIHWLHENGLDNLSTPDRSNSVNSVLIERLAPRNDESLTKRAMSTMPNYGENRPFPKRKISVGPDFKKYLETEEAKTLSTEKKEMPDHHFICPEVVNVRGNSVNSNEVVKELSIIEEKTVIKAKEDDAIEYLERSQKDDIVADPEEKLTWELLPSALAELLWFVIISQQNAAGVQAKLGVFDGSVVKKELIEKPINDRLLKLNLPLIENMTFKELMDYNKNLPEDQKFKQFYVTALNTETGKTEVFSAEHTPNVVIADAVRASMSIPVFFTPVTIQEKDESGRLQKRTCKGNVVHYMDGGILDNYPLWIFDNFKYCFDEDFKCDTNMRYSIQNPNTLGFRLLDKATIEEYTNPQYIGEKKTKEFKEKFSYQIGLLLNTVANEAQENEHLKRGDYTRSVYIDNQGISAISFSLGEDQTKALIESGRQSVKDYQVRANRNFNGEGQIN